MVCLTNVISGYAEYICPKYIESSLACASFDLIEVFVCISIKIAD